MEWGIVMDTQVSESGAAAMFSVTNAPRRRPVRRSHENDRVSLAPLAPEDALRALLNTAKPAERD